MSDTLRVNNFERDLDYKNHTGILTNDYANIEYRYDGDAAKLLNDYEMIARFIQNHIYFQEPRLKVLMDYYKGLTFNIKRRSIRRKEKGLADNRAAHDFAAYIADFGNGYFLGNPIDYASNDETAKDYVEYFNDLNDIDSHNRSLGLDLAIYGRAFEYIIRNQNDENRVYKCDAEKTFVIYDNTIEKNSVAAIRYWEVSNLLDEDDNKYYHFDLITDNAIYKFQTSINEAFKPGKRADTELHAFGKIPITEFKANELRIGDYEKVISQIDLLDNAQSDTANYMSDLNDAMLLIIGNFELSPDSARLQKESNLMHLKPPIYDDTEGRTSEGTVTGDYIYKQYDVNGVEAYKNRLDANIHKYTNTPNMNDANFSGVQSGESMKYKLFGLEQRAVIKEGLFEKGLRRRYSLLQEIAQVNSELDKSINLKEMKYQFKRNLPKALIEELQAYINAGGTLSTETLMMLFSFIPDVQDELKRIETEKNEQQKTIELQNPDIYDLNKVGASNAEEEQQT
ncbi:phage portal protein [Macrococcoides bohemicum]|uniref:phage portal protein n=1 Tax=Macrococcoides bohemicum TaxID=1903056 RepID=UPI00289AE930|nr:phage portal protein [Macrococcus bohemicus]